MRPVRFLLSPSDELLQRGIPPHSGLSYSIGFGLIVEGILSACYHLCPTRMDYQFGNNERATTTDYRVILSSGSFLDPGVLAGRFLFLYEKSGQVGGTFNLKERKMKKPWTR